MQHSDMDISSLHESRLIAIPQKEQGMAWLVSHGPLVVNPPLPPQVLRALAAERRIVRLRKGLYLAPSAAGQLPSLPATINLADPDGYISGHGALMLHGLNDQDISRWYSISNRRQADITYGRLNVHFVYSPEQRRVARVTTVSHRGTRVTVATVAQAFIDEVTLMPYRLDYSETIRVLRNALQSRQTTERELVAVLKRRPSVAGARRLGFMLEAVLGRITPELLDLARRNEGTTAVGGATVAERKWRLMLPRSRDAIVRASR